MSMSNSDKAWLAALLCVAAVATGAVLVGILGTANQQSFDQPPVITPPPTLATSTPTPIPTHNPTPAANPTTPPEATANPTPSPTPTPAPDATEFQNATLTYGQVIDQVPTWVVNGTLADTATNQGISGLTVTVVDATNSSIVYGTTTTGADGYFECTFAIMQPPTVQLVFAGTDQYLAATSGAIELPPA